MLLKEALIYASENLNNYVENPQLESRVILQHIFLIATAELLTQSSTIKLNLEQITQLHKYVAERKNNKPLAYILGYKDFWNSRFYIDNNVLIPRADTETLIESVLENFKDKKAPYNFLDVGTGSGNIILSLLQEYPNATGIALDVSVKALKIAKRNAVNLGLQNRVIFIASDILSSVAKNKRFHAIVSNPPYIDNSDVHVDSNVVKFEPNTALFAADNGLFFYKEILKNAQYYLQENGKIFFEVGFMQSDSVEEIAQSFRYQCVSKRKDLNKIDRVVVLNKTI